MAKTITVTKQGTRTKSSFKEDGEVVNKYGGVITSQSFDAITIAFPDGSRKVCFFDEFLDKLNTTTALELADAFLSKGFFDNAPHQHVGLDLASPFETTNLTTAGVWYDINGIFNSSHNPNGFELNENVLTYKGSNVTNYAFIGSSDVKVNKNTYLKYGLFINDDILPVAESIHTFSTPNAYELMAISKIIELNYGDTIKIKVQSGASSTTITPASLDTVFMGTR